MNNWFFANERCLPMQQFQQLVHRAIAEQATHLDFVCDQVPFAESVTEPLAWTDVAPVNEEFVKTVLQAFFPDGFSDNAKAEWEIPSFGKINIIGEITPTLTARLFFPSGQQLFEEIWAALNQQQAAAPVPPPPPDTPVSQDIAVPANPVAQPLNVAPTPPPPTAPLEGQMQTAPEPVQPLQTSPVEPVNANNEPEAKKEEPVAVVQPIPTKSEAEKTPNNFSTQPVDFSKPPVEQAEEPQQEIVEEKEEAQKPEEAEPLFSPPEELNFAAGPLDFSKSPAENGDTTEKKEENSNSEEKPQSKKEESVAPNFTNKPTDFTKKVANNLLVNSDEAENDPQQAPQLNNEQKKDSPAAPTSQNLDVGAVNLTSPPAVNQEENPGLNPIEPVSEEQQSPLQASDSQVINNPVAATPISDQVELAPEASVVDPAPQVASLNSLSQDPVTTPLTITQEPAPPVSPQAGAPMPNNKLSNEKICFGLQDDSNANAAGSNQIDSLLQAMVQKNARYLHLKPGEPVSMRVGDQLLKDEQTLSAETVEAFISPIIPNQNKDSFLRTNDTDFVYQISGLGRFKINLFRCSTGVGAVCRHIPEQIYSLDQLGMPEVTKTFCQATDGLVLITGSADSGTSTTLAAFLDNINKTQSKHIISIEDPIEQLHVSQNSVVTQREVLKHTNSFSNAIKASLKEDPDVVFISDLSDPDTVKNMLDIANMGRLVFAVIKTKSVLSTIDKIFELFSEDEREQIRTSLFSCLKGMISQVLINKTEGGQVAAYEVFALSPNVSAMLRDAKVGMIKNQVKNQLQSNKEDGNIFFNDSLLQLVTENIVDPKDALDKAVDRQDLEQRLNANNISVEGAEEQKAAS